MTKEVGETVLSLSIEAEAKGVQNIASLAEAIAKAPGGATAELIKTIFGGAIKLNASDVHFEPEKDQIKIRVRIDGILHDVVGINEKIYHSLLSRLKLLSGLKLNITDRPQDGRFTIGFGARGAPIEIRTSVIPAEYGESVVCRILNPQNLISLPELGLRKDLLTLFKREIKKPNGMIIVTGPTGSGKTTTLYAFLRTLQNPEIKIITIEDPIEYHLEGIEQTQVSKNYSFANGLQSIVRQDPDVILVGEIRDAETTNIALQAALTGHLVFSTLHTNDAAGTIARLVALGAKPFNIGPALNLVIAQRLVRKVCPKCVKYHSPSPAEAAKIQKALTGLSESIAIPKIKGAKIAKVQGCAGCNSTGYKGRTAIFEAMIIDSEMEDLIAQNPTVGQIRAAAAKRKMATMYQDGIIKVLQGVTTLEEVERVTAEKE